MTLAWAVSVNAAKLGASLEAYAEAKLAMDNFENYIFVRHSHSAWGRLPAELVDNIFTHLLALEYAPGKVRWTKAARCAARTCSNFDITPLMSGTN